MQRVFLIHGWTGRPTNDWFPWAKKELQKRGYEVFAPEMPDTDHPKIGPWVAKINEVVGAPRETIYLSGTPSAVRRLRDICKPCRREQNLIKLS